MCNGLRCQPWFIQWLTAAALLLTFSSTALAASGKVTSVLMEAYTGHSVEWHTSVLMEWHIQATLMEAY